MQTPKKLNAIKRFFKSIDIKIAILLFLFAFASLIFFLKVTEKIDNILWSNFWDPLVTSLTLLSTLALAIYNIFKNWEHNREKRITVIFIYNYQTKDAHGIDLILDNNHKDFIKNNNIIQGKSYPIMICFEAQLSGENDMRQWAQQIGGQMSGGRLEFFPYFETIEIDLNQNITQTNSEKPLFKVINHHIIVMHLRTIPTTVIEAKGAIIWDDNYANTAKNIVQNIKINTIEKSDYQSYSSLLSWYAKQEKIN